MIGSGGHARVLQDLLADLGFSLSGFVAPDQNHSRLTDGLKWLGSDDDYLANSPTDAIFVNGIGSAANTRARDEVFKKYKAAGHSFLQLTSAHAIVSESALLSEGVQVMPGAIVHTDAVIGENTIVNSGAIVEHHSKIGQSCHLATGSIICGDVEVGSGTHIGAGATVIQGISIGSNCIVGAGAVVVANIEDGTTAIGVPARPKASKG
jgi:UDP-perosamine 4-acetyltransferase